MSTQQRYQQQQQPQQPQQHPSPSSRAGVEIDFGRKEEDDGCCNCCIAPCKILGLILFLPCCIYSCCKARTSFQKEAKQYKEKKNSTDTISVEPRMKIAKPSSTSSASEMVSKLQNISGPKYKVEPAPDKVKVIDEGETSHEGNGIDNKDCLELEPLSSKN